MDKELVAFTHDHTAPRVDAGRGNDHMEMRVEQELLVPSVEDRSEPAYFIAEPFWFCQAVLQCSGHGSKEDVVGLFGQRAQYFFRSSLGRVKVTTEGSEHLITRGFYGRGAGEERQGEAG